MEHLLVFALCLCAVLRITIAGCAKSNDETLTKYYHDISCDIRSGDYAGSEINGIISGDTSSLKLTTAAVETEQVNVLPYLNQATNFFAGSVPVVGNMLASVFNALFIALDTSGESDPYQSVHQDMLSNINKEITKLYNYIDSQVNSVVYSLHQIELQQLVTNVKNCRTYDGQDQQYLDCLHAVSQECSNGATVFTTIRSNVVDYEQTFPMMREYGTLCSAAVTELIAGYILAKDSDNTRFVTNQLLGVLNGFISLYDAKLDSIIVTHTSSEDLHTDLECSLTEKKRYYISYGLLYFSGYDATCTEHFGHRSVARTQEECTVSRYVGCQAGINTDKSVLDACHKSVAECNKANALLHALAKLERYFAEYQKNRRTKLRSYWQNSVGVVVDEWRTSVGLLNDIITQHS